MNPNHATMPSHSAQRGTNALFPVSLSFMDVAKLRQSTPRSYPPVAVKTVPGVDSYSDTLARLPRSLGAYLRMRQILLTMSM